MADLTIDGTSISGVTIDGTDVQEVTIDGNVVWKALTIVDDFEDGDISEYSGDTGRASAQTNNVQNGSYSLFLDENNDAHPTIYSTSGLGAYPSQGDTFRLWARTGSNDGTNNNQSRILFGVQNSSDFYTIIVNTDDNSLRLKESGSGTKLADKTLSSINIATWYELEVQWTTSDDITVKLFKSDGTELGTISVTDSTYTSGGIGFGAYGGSSLDSEYYYDYFRII